MIVCSEVSKARRSRSRGCSAEWHYDIEHVDVIGKYLASTFGRRSRDHCGIFHHGRHDRAANQTTEALRMRAHPTTVLKLQVSPPLWPGGLHAIHVSLVVQRPKFDVVHRAIHLQHCFVLLRNFHVIGSVGYLSGGPVFGGSDQL